MIQGLRTAIYPVKDLTAAKAWYGQVLGIEPHFDEPFYVGYAVGGFELGLVPDGTSGSQGVLAYWGVPDAEAELKRLVALGARVFDELREVGGGIKVASVEDPFGNIFSIIENPHFDLASIR